MRPPIRAYHPQSYGRQTQMAYQSRHLLWSVILICRRLNLSVVCNSLVAVYAAHKDDSRRLAYNRYVGKSVVWFKNRSCPLLCVTKLEAGWVLTRYQEDTGVVITTTAVLIIITSGSCHLTKSRVLLREQSCFTKFRFWIWSATRIFDSNGITNEPHHCASPSCSRIFFLQLLHEGRPILPVLTFVVNLCWLLAWNDTNQWGKAQIFASLGWCCRWCNYVTHACRCREACSSTSPQQRTSTCRVSIDLVLPRWSKLIYRSERSSSAKQ